jgi:hypothetical protein
MKPKSRRGGEDAAALEIGFGRAGTHRLRFAPDPQRRRREITFFNWLELVS